MSTPSPFPEARTGTLTYDRHRRDDEQRDARECLYYTAAARIDRAMGKSERG
jgi:hypothetical protein